MSPFIHMLYEWSPILYALLFVGMIWEGEAVLFTTVLLVRTHVLNPYIAFFVSVSGLLIGDFLWHHVGIYLPSRFPRIAKTVNGVTRPFDKMLRKRPFRLVFISKFIYGIHHAILMRTGSMGMKLRDYAKLILLVDLLWYTTIVSVGYIFSESLGHLKQYLKYAELLFLLAIVLFIAIERLISYLSERALEREELDETSV